MKKLLISLIYLILIIKSGDFACVKKSSRPVKTYTIDLDKPAIERFSEIATDFRNEISAIVEAQKY